MAKLLARKSQLPVYVTNSMSFANAGMGGTVEEEMEAFKTIVQVISEKLQLSSAKTADAIVAPLVGMKIGSS